MPKKDDKSNGKSNDKPNGNAREINTSEHGAIVLTSYVPEALDILDVYLMTGVMPEEIPTEYDEKDLIFIRVKNTDRLVKRSTLKAALSAVAALEAALEAQKKA